MSGVVVLHFWSPTCGPCRVIKPALEDMKEEFADKIQEWVPINTKDDPHGIAQRYGVTVVPTLVFLKNNVEVGSTESRVCLRPRASCRNTGAIGPQGRGLSSRRPRQSSKGSLGSGARHVGDCLSVGENHVGEAICVIHFSIRARGQIAR